MKRITTWIFYGVGAVAIGYLALYAYAAFTGRDLQPGDPIHIFRKPDAPNYSGLTGDPIVILRCALLRASKDGQQGTPSFEARRSRLAPHDDVFPVPLTPSRRPDDNRRRLPA
jgi:hypothetical protein